ncbi:hypothetical protein L2E82_29888 [Cichorium intybus]|uniref:Uncharacterized protein n=1 Tax=Cichorium intybus TaxID=13427 RepID=A0ACB9CZ57_CICIN|nr:hypothetical protein L2E82_29888 [Cichorium intybus]
MVGLIKDIKCLNGSLKLAPYQGWMEADYDCTVEFFVAPFIVRESETKDKNGAKKEPQPLKNMNGQICQICGDTVGLTENDDVFVACNEHKGSPRVDGDDDEDDVDDLENEFDYSQGNAKGRRQWQGEDPDLSSSSRRESQQPVPLLTNGQQVSGEIPSATPDNLSIRSTSGPLGPRDKNGHYMDPRQPVPVRIVDPSKDLNSYGLGNVDWKERVEGWKLKQDKNIMQMANRYSGEGRGGEIEGTGSNGEELQLFLLETDYQVPTFGEEEQLENFLIIYVLDCGCSRSAHASPT